MKNKIILISVDNGWAHYGIRYLSAVLKKYGYNVYCIFLPHTDNYSEEIINQIITICKNSIFIGISSMTVYKNRAIFLKEKLNFLKIPIIIGGLFPTLSPDEALKYFDYICIGEAENIIVNLAETFKNKSELNKINNIWYRYNNKIYKNESGNIVYELDKIPFPDYDEENHYLLENNQLLNLKGKLDFFGLMFSILSSRGCPGSCTYCHNNQLQKINKISKNKVRYHSINYIISFLENIITKYNNINYIWIQDDDFFSRNYMEIKEFSELWLKKIQKPFFNLAIPQSITEEKVDLLVNAGLFQIFVGIQSGSKKISKLYGRKYFDKIQLKKMNKIVQKNKGKLLIKYDFIILNPFESEQDILDSINLILKLKPPFYASMNCLTFMPNTPIYKLAKRKLNNFDSSGKIQDYIDYRFGKLKKYNKHKYINLILCLIGQNNTEDFRGVLPETLIKILINKYVIKFFNRLNKPTNFLINITEKLFRKYNLWYEKKYGINLQLPIDLINNLNNTRFNKKKLYLVVNQINKNDSVSNNIFAQKKILKNYNIKILTINSNFQNINKTDILLIHYCGDINLLKKTSQLNCKKIIYYHNVTPPEYYKNYDLDIYNNLKQADDLFCKVVNKKENIVCVSEYSKNKLLKLGFNNVKVIPILLDKTKYKKIDENLYNSLKSQNHKKIISVGRILSHKNQKATIKILKEYINKYDNNIKLYFIGNKKFVNKQYYNELLNEIKKNNLEENIIFTSEINDEKRNAYYKSADILVMTSLHEGFGIPLIESMYFQVPIIAFDNAAIPETLSKSGVLIENNNYLNFIDKIYKILSDESYKNQIIKKERNVFEEKFSFDIIEKKWYNYLIKI